MFIFHLYFSVRLLLRPYEKVHISSWQGGVGLHRPAYFPCTPLNTGHTLLNIFFNFSPWMSSWINILKNMIICHSKMSSVQRIKVQELGLFTNKQTRSETPSEPSEQIKFCWRSLKITPSRVNWRRRNYRYYPLGKDAVSKTDEFSEKFHFQSKNLCCRFWTLNRAFSAWKWYKRVCLGYVFNQFNGNTMLNCCTTCISWEIGSYDI